MSNYFGGLVGRKLYVGNLPFTATEEEIAAKFGACGTVESAKVITDRDTGRSKGFGFVEMSTDSEAQAAIDQFNGQDFGGRPMTVNEARPQQKKGPRPRMNFFCSVISNFYDGAFFK